MSSQQSSNYNRREGWNDNQGGVESYGKSAGSGAYDPASTGQGGGRYGNSRRSGGGDNAPGAFGDDTTTWSSDSLPGGDMGRFDAYSSRGGGTGTADPDELHDQVESTRRQAQQQKSQRQQYDTTGYYGGSGDRVGFDTGDNFSAGGGAGAGTGGMQQQERQRNKPTFTDEIRGTAEQFAGSVTGKTDLKMRGEERKNSGF